MVHNAAWVVPYTFEFRAKLDDGATTGTGTDALAKYTFSAFQTDSLNPGGESWQPGFAQTVFGRWTLADDSEPTAIAEADNSQFQTYTVVCRFDQPSVAQLALNAANGPANVNLCAFDLYLNRDFSAPKASYHGTGFVGWPDVVDSDGRLDIGFPGPSSGQMTVDWVRWGNGVILDPNAPDAVPPVLTITRLANGLRISWTGGGTLQSTDRLSGNWQDETAIASGSTLLPSASQKFFRVRR